MTRRLLLVVLLPAVLAACSGTKDAVARGTDTGGVPSRGGRTTAPSPDPVDALPAAGPVARYRGPFAREMAVLAFQREAPVLLDASIARLRDETGLRFTDGRSPEVAIVDAPDLPVGGRAALRLVNGVRRPQIDVRASAIASGEFRAKEHLPALVAEAAVLASSPERAAPEWIVRGLPLVFSGGVERRAAELILGGTSSAPIDVAGLSTLDPAFRVAALQRIGVGERVLARFLDARLGGAGDAAALREVGVGSLDFLDAAAATEADRMLDRIREDERVGAIRSVRRALGAGDVAEAESALSRVAAGGGASVWVDSEVRLVRAETSLLRGEGGAAVASLDDVLARPESSLRLRDARFLRALAALGANDPTARSRAAEFARVCIDDPRAGAILQDLGVPTQDAFDLVSGDAAARAKSAARIGERGTAAAAPFLSCALRDGEASVRRAAVAAIGRIGAKSAAADLDVACGDSDAGVRSAAVVALAQIDVPRGLSRSRDLTVDPDESVRRTAAELVARLAPKPVEEPRTPPASPGGPRPSDPKAAARAPSATNAAVTGPLTPPDDVPPPPAPRGKGADAAPATAGGPAVPAGPAPAQAAGRPPEPVKHDPQPAPTVTPAPTAAPAPQRTPPTPPRRADPPPRPAVPPAVQPTVPPTPPGASKPAAPLPPLPPNPVPPVPVPVPPRAPTPLPPPTREKV